MLSENKLEKYHVYVEEFPDPKITIELNVDKNLYLKVDSALTFCNEEGNQVNESILPQLNATISLDDKSENLKSIMDTAAKNKIVNALIK